MLGVLARVVARPNPQINIGPVDTSCSFLVVDARRYDMPIVFASHTFSELTGYSNVGLFFSGIGFSRATSEECVERRGTCYTDGEMIAEFLRPKLSDATVDSYKHQTVNRHPVLDASIPTETRCTTSRRTSNPAKRRKPQS